jgi:hypothetical protein
MLGHQEMLSFRPQHYPRISGWNAVKRRAMQCRRSLSSPDRPRRGRPDMATHCRKALSSDCSAAAEENRAADGYNLRQMC